NAFTIDAATLLPSLFPIVVMCGRSNSLNYSLDSAAPTNPTGTPTINLGSTFASLYNSNILNKAVGALPTTNISTPSSTAKSTAQADLVVSSSLDILTTLSSSMYDFISQLVFSNYDILFPINPILVYVNIVPPSLIFSLATSIKLFL